MFAPLSMEVMSEHARWNEHLGWLQCFQIMRYQLNRQSRHGTFLGNMPSLHTGVVYPPMTSIHMSVHHAF